MARLAKAVAPHVSTGRCIVYVDFVGDVVPWHSSSLKSLGYQLGATMAVGSQGMTRTRY